MSKEQQQQHHHYQTRGAQKRSSNAEQQQQKRERDGQQQTATASKILQQQMFEQQIQQNLLMKSSIGGGGVASESEENSGGSNNSSSTGQQQQQQQLLQKQNSLLSNNSNHSTSQFSMYSGAARMDDEDPIFTLDEEVHAKSVERTRHFTADFDPTVSDDDDFQKDLHGGRAYSVSTRFPPRIRHSGRSGHPHQNTTGIFHNHHKLHGQHGGGVDSLGPAAPIIPASLPIQISRGFNWPPRELVGSLSEEEEISIGGGGAGEKCAGGMKPLERARARTTINPFSAGDIETGAEAIIGQQQNGGHHHHQQQNGSEREEQIGDEEVEDLYGRMQAYSRSIQPEDDPERIFGERPHRRYSISFKHVHPGAVDVDRVGNPAIGGGDMLETSEETGIMVSDPHGEDSIGGENIPPGLLANNPTTIIPAAANPTTVMTSQMVGPTAIGGGNAAAGGANGGGGTPRIIVPASLRG